MLVEDPNFLLLSMSFLSFQILLGVLHFKLLFKLPFLNLHRFSYLNVFLIIQILLDFLSMFQLDILDIIFLLSYQ